MNLVGELSMTTKKSKGAMYALGRLKTGEMNKTESAYAEYLEQQKRQGLILWYRFEGVKLRLADKTFYTPDFAVMLFKFCWHKIP